MSSLLGDRKEGLIFIMSAPAGTGKTTLVEKLMREFPSVIANISYTTRSPREGEIQGVHYHFITESEFEAKINAGDFLEYVKLYGTYYGTSSRWIRDQQKKGKNVVLVIDTQGALKLKGTIAATLIFIRPPSLDILKTRLIKRQTETPGMIDERVDWAQKEMEAAKLYDYQIMNDDLESAYQILRSVLIAETHRTKNLQKGDHNG